MHLGSFRWRTCASALAATLVCVAGLWLANPPSYFTNDDVTIRLGIEGAYVPGQPPTGYVMLTHAALAWLLAWVQPLVPVLPLWDLVVASTLVASVAVLAALGWSALGGGWLAGGAAVCVLAVAILPLLAGLQFTISAALAGGAAAALALVELGTPRPRRSIVAASLGLFVLGVAVRPLGAVAGALAFGGLLAPAIVLASAERRTGLVRAASVLAAAVALFAALQLGDRALYGVTKEWATFHQYHWMAIQLLDWGGDVSSADMDAMRAASGWSENDWQLLTRWFGVDPELHGMPRVEKAFEARRARAEPAGLVQQVASRAAAVDAAQVSRLVTELPTTLAGMLVLALAYGRLRGMLVAAALAAGFVALCVAVEIAFKSLPFRVLAPLGACLAGAAVLWTGALRQRPPAVAAVAALSILLAMAASEGMETVARLRANHAHALQVDREVEALRALAPSLVVAHADAFPAEHWWRPFRRASRTPPTIRLGENNQNPQLQRFLSETGRQPLLRALCADPSILLVAKPDRLEPATIYLREHFGTEVAWKEVLGASFQAWRCEPAAAPPPARVARDPVG